MQTLQQQFPILYGESANSKMKMWDISVYTIDHVPTIITKHGYIDGKIHGRGRLFIPNGFSFLDLSE